MFCSHRAEGAMTAMTNRAIIKQADSPPPFDRLRAMSEVEWRTVTPAKFVAIKKREGV